MPALLRATACLPRAREQLGAYDLWYVWEPACLDSLPACNPLVRHWEPTSDQQGACKGAPEAPELLYIKFTREPFESNFGG